MDDYWENQKKVWLLKPALLHRLEETYKGNEKKQIQLHAVKKFQIDSLDPINTE